MSQSGLEVFDETLQQTHLWLHAVSERLGRDDRQLAYHALRSTLQTLRDRLNVELAAKLAAQLPLLVRGIYYEGYDPSVDAGALRDRDAFLARVQERYGYREPVSTEELVTAVLGVLDERLAGGLAPKLRSAVGDLQALWPDPAGA